MLTYEPFSLNIYLVYLSIKTTGVTARTWHQHEPFNRLQQSSLHVINYTSACENISRLLCTLGPRHGSATHYKQNKGVVNVISYTCVCFPAVKSHSHSVRWKRSPLWVCVFMQILAIAIVVFCALLFGLHNHFYWTAFFCLCYPYCVQY